MKLKIEIKLDDKIETLNEAVTMVFEGLVGVRDRIGGDCDLKQFFENRVKRRDPEHGLILAEGGFEKERATAILGDGINLRIAISDKGMDEESSLARRRIGCDVEVLS